MFEKPDKWDFTTDVLVVGSGGAGLVAAIAAHDKGAQVTIIERSDKAGGTTAVSGAAVWVPQNHHMAEKGIRDSREEALLYAKRIAAGRVSEALIETYIDTAPVMIRYLEAHTPARFECSTIPDYHPDLEGGHMGNESRTLGPLLFDTKELGGAASTLRRNPLISLPMTFTEMDTWGYPAKMAHKLPFDLMAERMEEGIVGFGEALMGALYKGCLDRHIEPVLKTRALELIISNGQVIGLLADQDGRDLYFRTRKGVILACAGFEWNEELKNSFLPGDVTHPSSPPYNEGDGLKMAMLAGAQLGNMSEVWGWISMQIPGEEAEARPLSRGSLTERSLPHVIFVNKKGMRFVNEAASYNDIFKPFWWLDPNTLQSANMPSWHIFDQQFFDKYNMLTIMPGDDVPPWVTRADTLEELAQKTGIDPQGLIATCRRFNKFAQEGVDHDFQRGSSSYDHYWGDKDNSPNPSLGTIEKPPFYAMPNYCGALGTKGGPKINSRGQVLHLSGKPIPGLYAAGNVTASISGPGYWGAGGTIGPAMSYGFICGRNAAQEKS